MKKILLREYWQFLWRYLAPQRKATLFMVVLLLTSIVLQLIGPQVARSFIDAAQQRAPEQTLIWAAIVFILVSIAQQAMNLLATYWSERVSWTATNALRADLVAHLIRLDLGFYKTRTPGELIERVDGDVNALAKFFSSFVVKLVGNVLLLIGILVALSLIDLRLGLAFTTLSLLALVVLKRVRQFALPYIRKDREWSAIFFGYIGEVLTSTEDLRSNGAVPYAMRRFFGYLRNWMPVMRRARVLGDTVWMTAIAIFAVGDAMSYWFGGSLYRGGSVSLGVVYVVIAYITMLAEPIETIRVQLQELQRADAGITRVRELLEITSKLRNGPYSIPSEGALSVEFRGVSFAYDDGAPPSDDMAEERKTVLKNVSFKVEAKHMLGLVGRTGSGKTTIARLLFRFYDPQDGQVCVDGVDLRQANIAALRSRIGLVTQDVQLFEASLRDNITFFDASIRDQQVLAVLETLGLHSWLERLPDQLDTLVSGAKLSAGEAQLIALARVLLKDPGLIILDEASSRLDPATEALLDQALGRLLKSRTVIIIAHRLMTLERADEILILEHGQVIEHGSREQLITDPRSTFAELRRAGMGEVLL